jgi:tRNA(Ile)-lysidine synthase TilS/MesJ
MKTDKMISASKVCAKCVLPEYFPGVRFNSEGICNYCLDNKSEEDQERRKAEYRRKFEELIVASKGQSSYDAVMSFSGGKDSTYTMTILKEEYGLDIVAVTLDNGFLSNQALKNINNAVEKLGISHIFFKPRFDMLSNIFRHCAENDVFSPKTTERASTICTACMAIVKFSILRFALEEDIPFVGFGWSPGQAPITSSIMKNNPKMVKMMQKTLFDPLYGIAGEDVKPHFLEDRHFSGSYHFPYNIHPLAFLEYNEEKIYQNLGNLGWEAPNDVDANSTNCLLNSFANVVHKSRFKFNPYVFELAKMVREGYLSRAVALNRLHQEEDPEIVNMVKARLRITKNSLSEQ